MGLMKALYTQLHGPGGNKPGIRAAAEQAERNFYENAMHWTSTAGFNRWALGNQARRWADCRGCPLARKRTRVVYGHGDPDPMLLILGAAPSGEDDMSGQPFSGEAGKVLLKAAQHVGIDLARDAYLTTTVCCRPPQDRKPGTDEREACSTRLRAQLALLQPRLILLLGAVPMRSLWLVDRDAQVGGMRGLIPREHWPDWPGGATHRLKAVFLTHAPEFVLHQDTREKKRAALAMIVEDLRKVKRVLDVLQTKIYREPREEE